MSALAASFSHSNFVRMCLKTSLQQALRSLPPDSQEAQSSSKPKTLVGQVHVISDTAWFPSKKGSRAQAAGFRDNCEFCVHASEYLRTQHKCNGLAVSPSGFPTCLHFLKVNHLAEEMGEFLTSLASKTYLYSARRYVDLKSFVLAAIVEIVVRMTRSVNNKGF